MNTESIFERLCLLEGKWKGSGKGQYPTIDSFEYEEHTHFEVDGSYPLIHFIQRAYLIPTGEASHWESGFIRVVESGEVEISTAQDSGRVEVLRGAFSASEQENGENKLELNSVVLGNDDRLVSTHRVITFTKDTMQYTKYMSTRTTPEPVMQIHLEAKLGRV